MFEKQSELTFETSAIAATTAYATRAATRIDELAADNTADIDDDTAAETNDHADLSLYAVLLSKANLFSETEEMHKLLMSGCVNLMNHDQRSVYKNILSSSQYNDIIQKCSAMERLDTNDAVGLIDNMKVDFKDKKSTRYVILNIVSSLISDMACWKNEQENILYLLFEVAFWYVVMKGPRN
ncbi:hypothetical protein HPULCUR_000830 [Helicostylum pulchrum]|uniref:Uncharacterized protein n=1 Tax=Helicostylum pulchrum TaxID=562976 RepID=A0ABP9XN38_9FUNG